MSLATYATHDHNTRGRIFPEDRLDFRAPFQRDRDRIIHSTSFRRLMHKTQVFVVHESELYRTRLTHSIEVAQVARTLARRLSLNEDLAEVVALAHDLGHPPFGHTGEDVLHEKMSAFGGFDHNAQALRIVSELEVRYVHFRGLNLTWESLEGIAKHNGPVTGALPWAMAPLAEQVDLELDTHAGAEAQVAAIADDIAYNHHDLQDGLRSGLLSDEHVREVPILSRAFDAEITRNDGAPAKILRHGALSRFFAMMVEDVYAETKRRLDALSPKRVEDIRNNGRPLVAFSDEMLADINAVRKFLFASLYRHESVIEMRKTAQAMTAKTFDHLMENPNELPSDWINNVSIDDRTVRARLVCDYLSGMTDRFVSRKWAHAHGEKWRD